MIAIELLLCAVAGLSIGFVIGERFGIRDTERRWSDAVNRADEARRAKAEQEHT